jgi:hypothetical protein
MPVSVNYDIISGLNNRTYTPYTGPKWDHSTTGTLPKMASDLRPPDRDCSIVSWKVCSYPHHAHAS